ncbi:MAG TPA: hypothetical protein VNU19_07575, partial [Candidatus Acidoferrum sp.]|nr:hypothetical protein [Candidatus Acidoferrum sp.]
FYCAKTGPELLGVYLANNQSSGSGTPNYCGWVGFVCDLAGINQTIACAAHGGISNCVGAVIAVGSDLFLIGKGLKLIDLGAEAAAETAGNAERTTAVIGRQADTAVAKDWAGHEVLDLPANEWSIAKNDQWVQSVVDRKMPVYVGSPTTWPNLWDATAGRTTVFGRELQQFTNAGYTWDGWTMVPPGG